MQTKWSEEGIFDEEYPRPLLKRNSWKSLNGLWDYAINKEDIKPKEYDGKIRVPFCLESKLSGVERKLQPDEVLWYRTDFRCEYKKTERIILHFEAVDYECEVFCNGESLGSHKGGYLPFSFDITEYCHEDDNELIVKVKDPTDTGNQALGKQMLDPKFIYYTPVSGIWQSVWLEKVPENYIEDLQIETKADGDLDVLVTTLKDTLYKVFIAEGESEVYQGEFSSNRNEKIHLDGVRLWSPEDPVLYTVRIKTESDEIESYCAFRTIEVKKDTDCIKKIFLNGKPYFQYGPLDQGYWPEGIYTAPCSKAILEELTTIRKDGFNMIRKHVKIEPQYWYYCCDRLGLLVWQDIVSGGKSLISDIPTLMNMNEKLLNNAGVKDDEQNAYELIGRDEESRKSFEKEMTDTVNHLKKHPCIGLWTLFNESWGQFDSFRLTKILKTLDPDRPVDSASGWADQGAGDVISYHTYLKEFSVPDNLEESAKDRAWSVSECGGFTYKDKDHSWSEEDFGYTQIESPEELNKAYENFVYQTLVPLKKAGCSGVVYTQLSDVEQEVNGLFTYDRKVEKICSDVLKETNKRLLCNHTK